jgi:IS605 OrfB family transposase
MQLVEKHVISKSDPRYHVIDEAAFKSKNLYNAGNYEIRQSYIPTGTYLNYNEMQKRMQSHEAYKALPAKVSQQVLMQLAHDWESFFNARDAYNADPSKFLGCPKLPGYKHKTEGRNILVYTMQAISGGQTGGKKTLQRGIIKPSGLPIEVKTRQAPTTINQVRIVPHKGFYVVEIIYEQAVKQASVNPAYYAGIDIGKNDGWKQEANMGKRTNQNFVQIPHARLIAMLTYKAELVGITVKVTEESYTSKASLLDLDPLPVRNKSDEKHTFSGKRVKRGLYRASDGRKLNADINGAGNIVRKVAPAAFGAKGVEDGKVMLASLVVHPVRIVVPLTKLKDKQILVKVSGQ